MRYLVTIIILSISAIVVNAYVQEMEERLSQFISAHEQKIPYQGNLIVVIGGEVMLHEQIGGSECYKSYSTDLNNDLFDEKFLWIGLVKNQNLKQDYIEPTKLKSSFTEDLVVNHL